MTCQPRLPSYASWSFHPAGAGGPKLDAEFDAGFLEVLIGFNKKSRCLKLGLQGGPGCCGHTGRSRWSLKKGETCAGRSNPTNYQPTPLSVMVAYPWLAQCT